MIKLTINERYGNASREMTVECDSLTEAVRLLHEFNENENVVNVQEEQVQESGSDECEGVDWSQAPSWATMYGKGCDDVYLFYDDENYEYVDGSTLDTTKSSAFEFGANFYTSTDQIEMLAKREL